MVYQFNVIWSRGMSNKEIGDLCLIPREDLILIPEITDLRNLK